MKYECAVDEGVRIPMRDGVALVADVYRPLLDGRDAEPSPTILIRTCFNRKEVVVYRPRPVFTYAVRVLR